MSRYQIALSFICLLAVATGLYIIAQEAVGRSAPSAWGVFCLLACSALVMCKIIDRLPMSHEAIFRIADFKQWPELSMVQRHCLMLFDLPLFLAARDREMRRLGTETLFLFMYEGSDVSLQPVGGKHIERYFLKMIASGMAQYGLRVQAADKGLNLFNRKAAAELRLAGDDGRIIEYICGKFDDGDLVSLQTFRDVGEAGYISTLPEKEQYAYVMAMR